MEEWETAATFATLFVCTHTHAFHVTILIYVCMQTNTNFLVGHFVNLMCDDFQCVGICLFGHFCQLMLGAEFACMKIKNEIKQNETKRNETDTQRDKHWVYMHMVSWWHHCWTVVVVRDSSSSSCCNTNNNKQGFIKFSSSCSPWSICMLAQIIAFLTRSLLLLLLLHWGEIQ